MPVGQLWNMTGFYGADLYPATRLVVQTLGGAFAIIPVIIAIYYGGELVWRDRERRMHEIVDATAAPDWAHLIPKIAAITLVLLATVAAAAAAGVAIQAIKGYTQFELLNYLRWFVVPLSISCVLIAVLSVFVQVLVPQKFIGWGVMLLYLVGSIALATAGFEHNLYNYAGTPDVPLTDFDGTSRFGTGRFWFNLYWLAFALMLCVVAYGLWRRGTTVELRPRLKRLPARLRGGAGAVFVAALIAWLGIGGFIFYNTNVLNEYVTTPERERRMAELEKALLAYENAPRPKITDVKLDVQLFPNEPRAFTSGTYRIENRTGKPLNELHVRWNPKLDLNTFESRERDGRQGIQAALLPYLSARAADVAGRSARGSLYDHSAAERVFQRRSADAHRRQRHLHQQQRNRACPRNVARRAAAGSSQAPQIRPAARAASGQAGR